MVRSGRIERLLKLLQVLQAGHSAGAEELAAAIGVSRRTLFRDMDLLARAGLAFEFNHETGRYSAPRTALLPPVTLTHAEALALMLAAKGMMSRALMPDQDAALSAGLKLESMLPATLRAACGPLMERTEVRPFPASDPSAIVDTLPILQHALTRRQKVEVSYDSYAERRAILSTLRPYHLVYVHRGWYLIAYSEQAKRVQTYKIERMLQLRILDEGFRMDPDFRLDDYFGQAWMMIPGDKRYHVKIRFLPKVAGNVDEIQWHRTQKTAFEPGGSLIFEADVDGVDEISWWVLGYGDQAEVLEPPELRALLARHVERMKFYYLDKGRSGGTPA